MKKRMTTSVLSAYATFAMMSGVLGTRVHAAEITTPTQPLISGLDEGRLKRTSDTVAYDALVKTGFTEIDGKTYYLEATGEKYTGLLETDSGTYYFKDSGEMATGFVSEAGETMYFNSEGLKEEGIVQDQGKTYILDENGYTQTGWVEDNGSKYYLNEDGSVVTNETRVIDEKRYSFSESGAIETNVVKKGYSYDAKGVGTPDASMYNLIAEAALAQVGVNQDCTMLVTNSLKAVGINFHGAPERYLSLGELTNDPVPGDIIVYSGHVAIYIGNGQAVHGGWNGYTTAVFSVECSAPLIGYVHPTLPL